MPLAAELHLETAPLKLLWPLAWPSTWIFQDSLHHEYFLPLSMTISQELEFIFCQPTCPGFCLEVRWQSRALGCDSLSLTAYSCSHWLPGNTVKASLLCSPWLWSSIGQKQGDRRGSECFTALALILWIPDSRSPLCPPRGHLSCVSLLIDAPKAEDLSAMRTPALKNWEWLAPKPVPWVSSTLTAAVRSDVKNYF